MGCTDKDKCWCVIIYWNYPEISWCVLSDVFIQGRLRRIAFVTQQLWQQTIWQIVSRDPSSQREQEGELCCFPWGLSSHSDSSPLPSCLSSLISTWTCRFFRLLPIRDISLISGNTCHTATQTVGSQGNHNSTKRPTIY